MPKFWKVGLMVVLIAGLATSVILIRQKQSFEPQAKYTEPGVTIANLTDNSFSLWWKANDQQTGCVIINSQSPICDNRKALTHLISVKNLASSQMYQALAKHGQTTIFLSPFWSQGIYLPSSPKYNPPANPLFGQVITQNGRPLDQATVFIAPNLTDRMYLPLAVLTNDQGGFFFTDLSSLKFQSVYDLDEYFVEVTDKNGNKLLETVIAKDLLKSPFTITVP